MPGGDGGYSNNPSSNSTDPRQAQSLRKDKQKRPGQTKAVVCKSIPNQPISKTNPLQAYQP